MNLNFTRTILWFSLLAIANGLHAQDIHFSQFYDAPLYRNPALAGIVNGDVRVQTVYRSQWNTVANAYTTGSVNAEYKLPVAADDYLTLGMEVFYDKAGSTNFRSTHLLPAVNYHKSLSTEKNIYLSAGFMGGWVERRIDRTKMTTNSTYEGIGDGEVNLQPRNTYFDGTAGVSLNAGLNNNPENNLVLGVAYHHFNRPKNSFFNNTTIIVSPKWVYSADIKLALNEYSSVTIYSDHTEQANYRETMTGLLFGLKVGNYVDEPDYILSAGAFMRINDAVIPTIKMQYQQLAVSLSYDVNISRLASTSLGRGGFEFSASYVGFVDRYLSSKDATKCPRF
ncbi:MAG: PorP/SprF family type IX secretion system membrane protein [Candidatus Dadabacteria bacterium]